MAKRKGNSKDFYIQLARKEAARAGINPDLFVRQINQESGFQPNVGSSAGAQGIAQIVPKYHPEVNPWDPKAALKWAAHYMAGLVNKYGNYQQALSVYNSGSPTGYQHIPETINYVKSIMGGSTPSVENPPSTGFRVSAPGSTAVPNPRPNLSSNSAGRNPAGLALLKGLLADKPITSLLAGMRNAESRLTSVQPGDPVRFRPSTGSRSPLVSGTSQPQSPLQFGSIPGQAELFYDPLGGYKYGKAIGPIGGHSDHIHVAYQDRKSLLEALALAQKLGLHVSENPYVDTVDPVHVGTSYHYRTFPGTTHGKRVGEAFDASGSPQSMAALFKRLRPR